MKEIYSRNLEKLFGSNLSWMFKEWDLNQMSSEHYFFLFGLVDKKIMFTREMFTDEGAAYISILFGLLLKFINFK